MNQKVLLPYYLKYLDDEEPELRSCACANLCDYCEVLEADDITTKLAPFFSKLSKDSNNYVRESLASSILAISSKIGKKGTNDIILPIFLNLLKDNETDVKIKMFKHLDDLAKVSFLLSLSFRSLESKNCLSPSSLPSKNWPPTKTGGSKPPPSNISPSSPTKSFSFQTHCST